VSDRRHVAGETDRLPLGQAHETLGPETSGPHRLWGGRFETGPAPSLDALNRSLPVDIRIWREDVEASRAWAHALVLAGVLTEAEGHAIAEGLERVAQRLERGEGDEAGDEDVHTLIERLLYEEAGDVAGKLHTGRSRNDQVATATRLWALRAGGRLEGELRGVQAALLDKASSNIDVVLPGYTHLRRAQPVRAAHWLLSHFWALQRDRARLLDACDRTAILPLGSGAIAGSGFPVDRTVLKETLGFRAVSPNSMDAVGDRDWVCELVFVAALAGAHLSRLAEDLIIFSTEEFGFVELPEAYTTGSSLLPQKRNPDGLELARGKAALLVGDVAAALALLKSLPSGYHKDLQEDKTLLFRAVDALLLLLPATRETVRGLSLRRARMDAAGGDPALLATDIADELVRRGLPFREAHGRVGALVRAAEQSGMPLMQLAERELGVSISLATSLEARSVSGGTARTAVLEQLSLAQAALGA
jgi:argininosuccinate lyase